jgi:hypothetical protein
MNTDALTQLEDLCADNGIMIPPALEVRFVHGRDETIAIIRRPGQPQDEHGNRFHESPGRDRHAIEQALLNMVRSHYGADAFIKDSREWQS